MFRLFSKGVSTMVKGEYSLLNRAFSKIVNFKETYPVLYSHVHPDSLPIVNKPCIDSKTVIKWFCPKGPDHVWESDIELRIRSYKRRKDCKLSSCSSCSVVCLFCSWKLVSVTNSLASRHPEYIKEWMKEKNGDLTPDKITCFSTRDVWWQCPNNPKHQYLMAPQDRNGSHTSCPFCRNASVNSTNSLAALFPDIAAQWNYARNGLLTPSDVLSNYRGKVWWKCAKNPAHEWKSSVFYRTKRHGECPFCKELLHDEKSLSELCPAVAKEWNSAKNGALSPDEVSGTSDKIVWWRCEHGVEWKQTVVHRLQAFKAGRS